MTHIIKHVVNWREEDYDGYNDYFVPPEHIPSHKYYKGYNKQEKYKKIAEYYLIKYGQTPISFAVVEVTQEGINLIEDAF